ncbi:MAG: acyl--CoA ligase [Nitrospira sp.]|uniref:Long-chain fatty acid--CoA ligase n=1 Tax=Nitrospira defluvii TaxID=330214 RepID=A0ABM8R3D9_9BACT|nr:class I adenylate-forming enzyme family protein [Nitrospira defluvii]MCS6327115.1 acyl--CoA ligase [Nitrospira sp.]CAE6730825.1 Long-chain fatty acid--CoA ligase [Nitrospira defluvii]
MSLFTGASDRIEQARAAAGSAAQLPWVSFAEFFCSRVYDPQLATRNFLTYCDEERRLRRTYTYAELGATVERLAEVLHTTIGLTRGDRIATLLFNDDVTVLTYLAAWVLGIAVVPINIEESTERKRYILEHADVSAAFCWEDAYAEIKDLQAHLPSLREVVCVGDGGLHDVTGQPVGGRKHSPLASPRLCPSTSQLDDPALIVYTSGTTGQPKGVVLTGTNLLIDADAITAWHGFGLNDRLMCVLPIHHVNGIVVTLVTPLYCKGSVVLNRKFKTGSFWRRMHEEAVTSVSVVPTLLEFLLDADEDLASYRLDRFRGTICGAGPLLKETALRFEDRFGFPIYHGYGLSETTCYSSFLPTDLTPDQHRHWLADYAFPSVGLALRHNVMTILNDRGQPLPEGGRGEICIRGRTLCAGYYRRDDANEAAFQWGWFRSGDEGFYRTDERGRPFFFIAGRLKELIIRGGVNISPLEIDDVLKGHHGVKFAMAIPFENRYYGDEIAAYIVPHNPTAPPTEADLLAHCRSRLPFSKQPKIVILGEEVPYTATGKPKRLELQARLASTLAQYRDRQFREQA